MYIVATLLLVMAQIDGYGIEGTDQLSIKVVRCILKDETKRK